MKTRPKIKPRKIALHIYKIEDGETHWYVASGPTDALKQYVADQGYKTILAYRKDNPEPQMPTISPLLDDEELTIGMEKEEGGYDDITDTCAEWTKSGKGCIATTNV